MSYLDRLKAQNSEKQAPKALSKPPKVHYDSFDSSQMAHFPQNNEVLPNSETSKTGDLNNRSSVKPEDKAAILRWLHFIGENSRPIIDDVLAYSAGNPDALAYYLKRAEEVPPPDDRHHCRECRNLNSRGYCIRHRFRPVDDIPRRCEDFRADAPSTIQGITHD